MDGVIFMGLLTMCQFIGEGDGLRKGTHGEFELLLPFVEIKCREEIVFLWIDTYILCNVTLLLV